jgi:hypothetical protein
LPIYLGRRSSIEGWVSFESDSKLTRTKERLYGQCLPCMTSLWEQLGGGATPAKVKPGRALDCWKVTVALPERDDCLNWLEHFERLYPEEEVYGKLGKGAADYKTHAVIFHTESTERRDELMALASAVCVAHSPKVTPSYSRGCAIPYEQLLGPWPQWSEECPIKHPERVREVKASLRRSLFRA